jgi:predicted dehydrogenase
MYLSTETKYRVGVIGCGRKGTHHARACHLHPSTEVVAVVDTDSENLELACSRFNVPGYANHRDMFEKEQIDIAVPVLPVGPNPEVVVDCAEAKVKAILCEKPMSASLEDADRMVEACRSRGIKFGVGDIDRNLPDYWKVRELIEAGELGEVRSITFMGGSGTEMSGAGIDQFSLIRLFSGDADVAWVIGWVADDPASDNDQGGAGYLRFVNGIEAFIHRLPDARGDGFEVLCSRGVVRSNKGLLQVLKSAADVDRPTRADLKKVEGVFRETSTYGRRNTEYDAEGWKWPGDRNLATVQSMVDALEKDIEPRSSGDNALKVLEIAVAIRESHRRGHAPLQLPLADRSLGLWPGKWRMENKKPILGQEAYMEQMGAFTKS